MPFIMHLKHVYVVDLRESGMQQIYKNWDGPNYVLNAIADYRPDELGKRSFINRPTEYYAAHFPLLSWMIRPLGYLIGYFESALIVSIATNIMLNIVFYQWARTFSKHPLWLTFAFTIFPPRYWIVRATIAPEMFMTACMIAALWKWERGYYVRAGLLAFCAVLAKFQAVILVPVFCIATLIQRLPPLSTQTCLWRASHRTPWSWQIPIAILLPLGGYGVVSYHYLQRFGDAHAYFTGQKLVGMGASLPFAMFDQTQKWVGTGWLEHTALYLCAGIFLTVQLWQYSISASPEKSRHIIYPTFATGYVCMLSLIPQVDIMRLAFPLSPLFFMTYHHFFESKLARLALILCIPMFYLYVLNFLMFNQAPIADWGLFR